MRATLLAATLVVGWVPGALASSYQTEVGAQLNIRNDTTNSLDAYAVHHFAPVNPGHRYPRAQASYTARASNLFARAEEDLDRVLAGLEFYVPDTQFYARAALINDRTGAGTDSGWIAQVGVMPLEHLRITTTLNDDGYDANLQLRYLLDLGAGHFVHLDAGVLDTDAPSGRYFEQQARAKHYLGADFYLDRDTHIGAEYANTFWGDEITLRTGRYVRPGLNVALAFADTPRGNRLSLHSHYRF
ncbi:hypothetical protein [Marinimicrobium alkaliphilum]|uniref:hypothetical protein n=1 Tax=Marinimicrobium alkaliphilum TaxID=2202654 RepID=UPI000DB9D304|nr:hypothetical protein [Marinimicrobium alkaliphilum]